MKQINELVQMSSSYGSPSDSYSTNSSSARLQSPVLNSLAIPSSLVAPKRQRRSTDHSKIVVKNYKKAAAPTESGAVLTHFKSLSYKPQKRLRKKKKADPKLVDFLWRQIDSADIHAVSVFDMPTTTLGGWCCATNKFHPGHHHHACMHHKSCGGGSKGSGANKRQQQTFVTPSFSTNDDGIKKNRTSISIRELLL